MRGSYSQTLSKHIVMKLVFLIKALDNIGGTERVTIQIANQLSLRGHQVHIVSLVGNEKPFFEVFPAVQLHYIHKGSDNSIFPYRDLRRHYRLKKCFSQLLPDVIIVVDASRATFKIPACKPYTTIYWEHFNSLMRSKPMQRLSRKLVSKHGDWVVTLTQADAQSYRDLYHTERVSCIHNPITIDVPPYTPPTAHQVVAVGRYTAQKGFDLLLQAWAKVAEKKDWQLLIVGKGKQTKLLQKLIDQYQLAGSVQLLPPTNGIQELFSKCGLYVLSSRFEGLPLVLIEAAAMGLPAVSFDCQTGPREIIAHGQTGLLVPPLQVNALADALQTCLLDDAIRMRYSQQAATYVGKKFAVDTVVDQWEALFKQLKSRPL
jgi:glycosyltransferase involved in cell wall biosynthesis